MTDQYNSGGIYRQNQLTANINLRARRYSVFGYYSLSFANADTSGFGSYPTIPYNLKADYGRASFDVRSRIFLGGNIALPYLISVSPLIVYQSGSPYNIVTGTDLFGDNNYQTRPTFLPGRTSASCTDASTFVVPPTTTNYNPIPINYCVGPSQFTTNVRVSKTIGFGPADRR